ncbi:MAG: hypothetical protein U1E34_08995 [Amaricoccus sp.]
MTRRIAVPLHVLLILWLPLAGLTAGLSYRLPPEQRDPGLAFWLAAGGRSADLCADRAPKPGLHSHCDACPQAGAALLPMPGGGKGRPPRVEIVPSAVRRGWGAACGSSSLGAAPRGPPAVA